MNLCQTVLFTSNNKNYPDDIAISYFGYNYKKTERNMRMLEVSSLVAIFPGAILVHGIISS